MTAQFEQEAVFIGANKQNFVVDYNYNDGVVAYGAGKVVALWRPVGNDGKGVISTLKAHTKEVTCVRFLPGADVLVTAAEDFQVNLWHKSANGVYKLAQTLDKHKGSVTCVAVLNDTLFVTGGSDGEVIVWGSDAEGNWSCVTEFTVKAGFFPLSMALEMVKQDQYVLAIGGTNFNLYIYTFEYQQGAAPVMTQSAVLTGHEDWIKCLSFIKESEDDFLLASGSQDRYIRLWRLRINEKIDNSDEDSSKLILLSNKQYKFSIGQNKCAFSFEALIMGHDDWVTGLAWHPTYARPDVQTSEPKKLQLLSSSADTALMIWEMDYESGIWVCVSRLGELSIKGASTATGASGGFWSCTWFSNGGSHYLLTNGKTGSIRVYKSDGDTKVWESQISLTGPNREVTDLVWSLDGDYFMATSLDQTTRLIAPWKHNGIKTWHEFARPQIHGYDMICIDNLSPTKFVSAGDEKILRVFEMTHSINKLLKDLCGIDVKFTEELPDAAALPVLGLSNKAANEQLEEGEASQQREDHEQNVEPTKKEDILEGLDVPPLEDYLQRFTLFPEMEKLYGHGYEVTCCATSPNRQLIATACKSNSVKHGMLRLFNVTKDFQPCSQTLPGHNLTVTNIAWSPDGAYLLSVSRDRQFILWEVIDEATGEFKLFDTNAKAHTRIIWDCAWVPHQLGNYFVTVGRDKQVKLWGIGRSEQEKVTLVSALKVQDVVTAVSVHKEPIGGKVVVAIGLENGDISVLTIDLSEEKPEFFTLAQMDKLISPADKISKLSFGGKDKLYLAVGSGDSSIRLYNLQGLF